MSHQVENIHWPAGRDRGAVVTRACAASHHFLSFEVRQILLNRVEDGKLPLIDEHHDACAGDGLGQRGDAKDAVRSHWGFRFDFLKTDSVECGHVSVPRDQGDNSGSFAGIGEFLHANGDSRRDGRRPLPAAAGSGAQRRPGLRCRRKALQTRLSDFSLRVDRFYTTRMKSLSQL